MIVVYQCSVQLVHSKQCFSVLVRVWRGQLKGGCGHWIGGMKPRGTGSSVLQADDRVNVT